MKLIAPKDKIIVEVDLESKNSHTFQDGTKIRLERGYDNFNGRYTNPVNGVLVDGMGLKPGTPVIMHHNTIHDTNKVFSVRNKPLCGTYSVPIDECYLYFDKSVYPSYLGKWKPFPHFSLALRLFEPYKGAIQGIQPTLIKNKLYITDGEYSGNVMAVLKSSDYEVIFQDQDGKEKRIIRVRSSGERDEMVAMEHDLTNKVNMCEVLIGLSPSEAKIIYEYGN
jgi:hypothetical protein